MRELGPHDVAVSEEPPEPVGSAVCVGDPSSPQRSSELNDPTCDRAALARRWEP